MVLVMTAGGTGRGKTSKSGPAQDSPAHPSRYDHTPEGGSCVSEMTQEEALRLADELVQQALKEAGARCTVLAAFIQECDRAGATTPDWSEALRELHALQASRRG